MCVGARFGGRRFADLLGNHPGEVAIREDGCGVFPVNGGSVSVWVPKEAGEGR